MPSYSSPGNGSVFVQSSAPTSGDGVFVDSDNNKLYALVSGTATEIGGGIAAGIVVAAHTTTTADYTVPASATASSSVGPDFTNAYTTNSGWTQVGAGGAGSIDVNNNVAARVAAATCVQNADHRVHRSLTVTASDTVWTLDGQIVTTASSGTGLPICLTAGTGEPSTAAQDMCCIYFTGATLAPAYKDGAGAVTAGSSITITHGTTYYFRLTRTSATNLRLNIYTDSARTTHQAGSPVNLATLPATVIGLTTIQHATLNNASADTNTWNVDTVDFYNNSSDAAVTAQPASQAVDNNTATRHQSNSEANPNIYVDVGASSNLAAVALRKNANDTTTEILIQTSTDAVSWTTRRTVTSSNITAGSYTYWRMNVSVGRYVRIYGNAGTNVMSYDEIGVYEPTDQVLAATGGNLSISTSDTSLNGAGT